MKNVHIESGPNVVEPGAITQLKADLGNNLVRGG